jgi:hypothetical protein
MITIKITRGELPKPRAEEAKNQNVTCNCNISGALICSLLYMGPQRVLLGAQGHKGSADEG